MIKLSLLNVYCYKIAFRNCEGYGCILIIQRGHLQREVI